MTTLHGNDIAGVNGPGQIDRAKGDFVIIKAGEGLSWHDPLHSTFVAKARARGLLVGHYWYPWCRYDAVQCARNFCAIAAPKPGEIMMLDFEEAYHKEAVSSALWPEWAIAFTAEVKRLTGAVCWLYLNDDLGGRMMRAASSAQRSALTSLPLVKARYSSKPGSLLGWKNLTLWQYDAHTIDKDVFYGGKDTWNLLAVPGASKAPAPKPPANPGGALIEMGDSGSEVESWQEFLNTRPAVKPNLVVDGVFGTKTKRGVEQFQKGNHLVVDGVIGPKTKAARKRIEDEHKPAPKPKPTPTPKPKHHEVPLVTDGVFGRVSVNRLEEHAGIDPDGYISSQPEEWKSITPGITAIHFVASAKAKGSLTIAWLQRKVGVHDDGKLGPDTIKGVQRYLKHHGFPKITVDGVWGERTSESVQYALNRGVL